MTWSARKKIDELERENQQLRRVLLTFYDTFVPGASIQLTPREERVLEEAEQILTTARKYGLMDESTKQNGATI